MARRTATALTADHYRNTVQALKADPIIGQMAAELNLAADPLAGATDENGQPTFNFMQAANREYARRGGRIEAHIGGVAEAITGLLADD